jgi:glycosyltransferase involved in cell wall biosynthesis
MTARAWTPAVSVVVPTRDRPALLERAVASILDQDYDGDIECIVVFDGTPVVLPTAPERSGRRLRGVPNQRTPGIAGARNTGYLLAEGELVAACDDDDEWLPGKLTAQVRLLAQEPQASVVACAISLRYRGRETIRTAPSGALQLRDLLRNRNVVVNSSTYLTRLSDLRERIGLIDESLPGGYAEDYEWLLRAVRTGPVVCVPEVLARIYWNPSSYFTGRWQTIHAALSQLLKQVPEFSQEPRGLGRIEGQLALADAAMGRRREAWAQVRVALSHNPGARQAWAALLILTHLVSADRILELGRRMGRGV